MNVSAQSSNIVSMTFVRAVRAGAGDRWFYGPRSFTDPELAALSRFFDQGVTRGAFHHFNLHHVPLQGGLRGTAACFDIYDGNGKRVVDIMMCLEEGEPPEIRFSSFRGLDNVKVFAAGRPEDRAAVFDDFQKKLAAEINSGLFAAKSGAVTRILDAWARHLRRLP